MENNFKFVMPADLSKAEDGSWKVRGLASTQGIDQQGETIIQKGIDLTPIDQKRGVLNWDHKKGPENTIGTLEGYSFGENGLYIEGNLFKNHSRAIAVKQIMDSLGEGDRGRMGLSVEGQILERDPVNPKIIKKCKISAVALTMNPVNSSTYAGLVKSMSASEFDSEDAIEFDSTENNIDESPSDDVQATFSADQVIAIVKKALAMSSEGSYSKAPNTLTNGDAMATSDLKPEKKKKKKSEEEDQEPAKQNMVAKGGPGSGRKGSSGNSEESYEDRVKKLEKEGLTTSDAQSVVDAEDMKKERGVAKALKPMTSDLYKSTILKMMDKLQILHPEVSRVDIWEAVKERLDTKFPNIYSSNEENKL